MADSHGLGPCAERRKGSTPFSSKNIGGEPDVGLLGRFAKPYSRKGDTGSIPATSAICSIFQMEGSALGTPNGSENRGS